jgi:hypothetical protein
MHEANEYKIMNMCQKYGIIFGHINDMELPLWNSHYGPHEEHRRQLSCDCFWEHHKKKKKLKWGWPKAIGNTLREENPFSNLHPKKIKLGLSIQIGQKFGCIKFYF